MTTKAAVKGGDKTLAAATQRLMDQPAIDLADLSILMGVSVSTAQRQAAKGSLPVPVARIGQRWIVPTVPVRKLLHLDAA